MSNQKIYIPSGGIGEIEYDDQENNWFQTSSAEFYEQNHTIVSPNLISLTSRCYRNLAGIVRYENYSGTTKEIIKTTTNLAKSYAKIKKYSENLICAFDDALIEHCMEIYKLFLEIKQKQKIFTEYQKN